MKQFFKDLFTSDHSNSQISQQPIYSDNAYQSYQSYQIPSPEISYVPEPPIRRTIIKKGPSDAGPQYNIAGS
jgi:hypothetical protein